MLSAYIFTIIGCMKLHTLLFVLLILPFASLHAAEEEPVDENATANTESSAAVSPPPPPRTEPNIDRTRISGLMKEVAPDTEILELETGKDGEIMFGFFQEEGLGEIKGGIILFPDEETHQNWPDSLRYLRQGMTDFGWYTLAVYLPKAALTPLPKRTLPVLASIKSSEGETSETPPADATETETEVTESEPTTDGAGDAENTANTTEEAAQESSTAELQEAYSEQVYRLGSTAFNHFKALEEVNRIIVLGEGTGAVWAADYVRRYQGEQNIALVMIDPRNPTNESAVDLMQILPEVQAITIDLYHGPRTRGTPNMRPESPKRRLRLAKHKRMDRYHQLRMPALSDNWKRDNTWLLKYVRGAIKTHISIPIPVMQNESGEDSMAEKAPG